MNLIIALTYINMLYATNTIEKKTNQSVKKIMKSKKTKPKNSKKYHTFYGR